MRRKLSTIQKFIILLVSVGILFYLGFRFIDNAMNGLFVDWFTRQFTHTESVHIEGEASQIYQRIDWYNFKIFLEYFLGFLILFLVALIFSISRFYGKYKSKKAIQRAGSMMHKYMEKDLDAEDVFPPDFTDIRAQMVEIKAAMQKKEQILRDEAQRKSDLITYLAHDLKTPLTSVIGYLSLLDEAPDMPENQKEKYIHVALNKANRLEKLIGEFFEITQYNLQNMVLESEMVDVTYMLIQMAEEFYPILSEHGNTVQFDMPEEMSIYGDAEKLARVFNNILKNAIAYSYENTTILITGKQESGKIFLSFKNKGKTIPEHKLEQIFQKFFRMDEARRSYTGGAGLGLAIAKEIIELHGGTITAASRNEETVFTVTLPEN